MRAACKEGVEGQAGRDLGGDCGNREEPTESGEVGTRAWDGREAEMRPGTGVQNPEGEPVTEAWTQRATQPPSALVGLEYNRRRCPAPVAVQERRSCPFAE